MGPFLTHSSVLVLDQTSSCPSYFTLAPAVAVMVWAAAVGVEGVVVLSRRHRSRRQVSGCPRIIVLAKASAEDV